MKPREQITWGKRPRVAVIGSGVAGMTAAWMIRKVCDVEVFEPNDYLGGHTRTIRVPEPGGGESPVDMGFIVMNHRNYPLFTKLLEKLDVRLADSDMSFSYHEKLSGYAYCGSGLRGLFARRANLVDPRHWSMLRNVMRFNRDAQAALEDRSAERLSLGEFVDKGQYGRPFEERYLLPMAAAIWSTPLAEMRSFPAAALFRFFVNHGLLSIGDRPQWRYVVGGSQTYMQALAAGLTGKTHTGSGVASVTRHSDRVDLGLQDGTKRSFDYAIIASHADQAFAMLSDPFSDEKRLLRPWRYQANSVVLHTDTSVMPAQSSAWASWNTVSFGDNPDQPIAMTYDMNRLQRLDSKRRYLVSLNMDTRLDPSRIIHKETFTHPTYTFESMATQQDLPRLNGAKRTFFCGSYFGYGFHEDAVRSAAGVAEHFGEHL